jgi:hypothetical protein
MTCVLVLLVASGCVSHSTDKARQRAAYLAGEQQAASAQVNATTVWVVGNVRQGLIPYTDDLTLAKALVEADYLGQNDPSQFIIRRNGQPPTTISAKQLLSGFDMPLAAGDRIEVRP